MTDRSKMCPICGEGKLHTEIGKNSVEYKGNSAELDICFSICDTCGSEQSDAVQLRTNKRAMVAFKKYVDGLLTGTELRALRNKLGLKQAEASQLFGGGPVSFSKYENDDVMQSVAMDKLLRLAAELPVALEYLARHTGMEHIISGQDWKNVEAWHVESTHHSKAKQINLYVVSRTEPDDGKYVEYAA